VRCTVRFVDKSSGVGVLDKAVAVLEAVAERPLSLAELVERTGIPRPTAHRTASALAVHGLVRRTPDGRFGLGSRLTQLATAAAGADDLLRRAALVLPRLRDQTGESSQLYVRRGAVRVCVAAAEREHGLRDSVPVGAELPMSAGSAAQVLLAFAATPGTGEPAGAFSPARLAAVREAGYAVSVAEREAGVASVSAPVTGTGGQAVAAVSVSGPAERFATDGQRAGRRYAVAVLAAARELSAA
jgi:DNA-binding IclR family transcriptional regulator